MGYLGWVLSFTILSSVVLAAPPLRDASKLWEPKEEEVLRVPTARIILADYDLIKRDFPEVRKKTNDEIDQWLLRNTAYMSKPQVAQQVTNTEIPVNGETRIAYRPREYGRAHVFKVDTGGLIDAKGTGGLNPRLAFERTGLATLGEMIREFLFEKMVRLVFGVSGKYKTIESYAVIDWGFTAKGSGTRGQDVPAGAILRRAHVRHHEGVIGSREYEDPVVLPNDLQLEMELELRRFGVTSAIDLYPGRYGVTQNGDQLNIQGAADGAMVDFAGLRVRNVFDKPIYFTYDKQGNAHITETDLAMRTDDKRWVQPDPKMSVPFDQWGNTVRWDSQDNVLIWSEELAAGLAGGWAGRKDAEQHIRNLLGPVEKRVAPTLACQSVFMNPF